MSGNQSATFLSADDDEPVGVIPPVSVLLILCVSFMCGSVCIYVCGKWRKQGCCWWQCFAAYRVASNHLTARPS
jgi:hypothetical protein